MDKDIDFEQWWDQWTHCPRCKMSDATRLAASNAWYNRQHELVEAQRQLTKLKSVRDAAVEELRFYGDEKNYSHFPATSDPDCMHFVGFIDEETPGGRARAVLAMIDKGEK